MSAYTAATLPTLCAQLAADDARLAAVLREFGPPPFWRRAPGFECLVRIILEQQVSLASAWAALVKLRALLGRVTPRGVLGLDDARLKACGFSRQKTRYARELAGRVERGELDLERLAAAPDDEVRVALKAVPGIGDWTVDVYLLLSLNREDVFPLGDLALVKSLTQCGFLPPGAPRRQVAELAERFRPRRSIFAILVWHAYIQRNGLKLDHMD